MLSLIKKNAVLSRVAYRYFNYKIAKKQYRENQDVLHNLEKWKNIHNGARCFIIGTGPSLTIEDLELLKDEITFGTNRIYELFDATKWRPTYYINQDSYLIKTFADTISNIECEARFIPVTFRNLFPIRGMEFFLLKEKEYYPKKAPFSIDISKYIAQGFTVTYGAIQLAIYMGFKEIYLLGVDHNYNISRDAKGNIVRNEDTEKNYTKGLRDNINNGNLPRIEETTIAYETADIVSRQKGVRVYNATRGGKLDAFERVDLDKLFSK